MESAEPLNQQCTSAMTGKGTLNWKLDDRIITQLMKSAGACCFGRCLLLRWEAGTISHGRDGLHAGFRA